MPNRGSEVSTATELACWSGFLTPVIWDMASFGVVKACWEVQLAVTGADDALLEVVALGTVEWSVEGAADDEEPTAIPSDEVVPADEGSPNVRSLRFKGRSVSSWRRLGRSSSCCWSEKQVNTSQ